MLILYYSICQVSSKIQSELLQLQEGGENHHRIRESHSVEKEMEMETQLGHTSWTNLLTYFFLRGRHLSYQRGKRNTNPGTSLIKIEGVDDTKAAKYVAWDLPSEDGFDTFTASISERRLLSFTVRKERLEDQRLESSGAKLPDHMVCSNSIRNRREKSSY